MTRRRMIVWQGVSVLDNATPIVVLATYDDRADGKNSSANAKTGDMVQTFILRDDVSPVDAIARGLDQAICGVCPHRARMSGGSGACYVQVWNGPQSTWNAYKRDGTRTADKARVQDSLPYNVDAFAGRLVRIGSYGDPAAVPFAVWEAIVGAAAGVTGYTHQWTTADPQFSRFLMASADSTAEGKQAKAKGYRSFIVRKPGEAKPRGAIMCPASAEAGKRTVCASCLHCGGTDNGRKADISIIAHGATRNSFRASLPLMVVR